MAFERGGGVIGRRGPCSRLGLPCAKQGVQVRALPTPPELNGKKGVVVLALAKLTAVEKMAVRIVRYLSERAGEKVKKKVLCEALGTRIPFANGILLNLRIAGIIDSEKGPQGGIIFRKTCTALDIIEVVSGKIVTKRPDVQGLVDDLEADIETIVAARLKEEVFYGVT